MANAEARSGVRRAIELFFFVAALALLGFLLHRIGWGEVARAIVGIGAAGVAIMLVLGLGESLLDGVALQAAVRSEIGLFRVFAANCAGSVVNTVAPWELGEVTKGAILGRHASAQSTITGVVIWNYAFKLTRPVVSLVAAVVGAILWKDAPRDVVPIVLAANVLAFAPYVVLRLILRSGPAGWIIRLTRPIPPLRRRTERLADAATALDHAMNSFSKDHAAAYRRVLLAQVLARLVSFAALFAAIRLVGLDYGLGEVALLYAGMNVADYVVAALPARIGVNEGAAFVIFQAYGLSPEGGLLAYVVLRLKMLIGNGIPAALAALRTGR